MAWPFGARHPFENIGSAGALLLALLLPDLTGVRLRPGDLVGSGRGVFLWPLLDTIQGVAVTAIDRNPYRVRDIDRVANGGASRLAAVEGDVTDLPFEDRSFDVVTALEVLEHLE